VLETEPIRHNNPLLGKSKLERWQPFSMERGPGN